MFVSLLMFACFAVTSGCHKNRARTVQDMPVPVSTTATGFASSPEPDVPAPEPDVTEPDPLSGELGDLNQYLRRQGLLVDTYFDFDRSSLSFEAREQLAKSAQFLQERPQFMVTLEGHCDERGTSEYNLALGERRARAARDYLVSLGVPASRLATISYGEERPVCTEPEESCWWQNRRAHPVVTARSDH
jgi:peptidoglycan-associated lipoprotein